MVKGICPKGGIIGFCVVYACPDGCDGKKGCTDGREECPLDCDRFPQEKKKCVENR